MLIVLPTYSLHAKMADPKPGNAVEAISQNVSLNGLSLAETEAFGGYFLRRGYDSVTVNKTVAVSWPSEVGGAPVGFDPTGFQQSVGVDVRECLTCSHHLNAHSTAIPYHVGERGPCSKCSCSVFR